MRRSELAFKQSLKAYSNKGIYYIFSKHFDATAYIWLNLGFIPHINYDFAVIEYNQRILTRVSYEIVELISSFVPVENYTHTIDRKYSLTYIMHEMRSMSPARLQLFYGSA
jgi:hypothetical protein